MYIDVSLLDKHTILASLFCLAYRCFTDKRCSLLLRRLELLSQLLQLLRGVLLSSAGVPCYKLPEHTRMV